MIVSHPKVAEAAVIGVADEDTGQAISPSSRRRHDPATTSSPPSCASTSRPRSASRAAEEAPLRRRPAQDPLREDHAEAPARRGPGQRARRRDDAPRPVGVDRLKEQVAGGSWQTDPAGALATGRRAGARSPRARWRADRIAGSVGLQVEQVVDGVRHREQEPRDERDDHEAPLEQDPGRDEQEAGGHEQAPTSRIRCSL